MREFGSHAKINSPQKRHPKNGKSRVKNAVLATPSVCQHYQNGLQALGSNSYCVQCRSTCKVTGNVDVDSALKAWEPDSPRWDYGIGVIRSAMQEVAIWVEVHPASSTHVRDVLAKLSWLHNWLKNDAKDLHKITHGDFYWIASGGKIAITPGSPQAKRLAAKGLHGPKRMLTLQ